MSFYTRVFNALPLSFARSSSVIAEFERIATGFTEVQASFDAVAAAYNPYAAETVAARQGQASMLLNLQRYVSVFEPMPGNVDAGGNRVRNAGDALLDGDYTTLRQLMSFSMSPSLPAPPGADGKVVRRTGGLSVWDEILGLPVAISANATIAARTIGHADCSAGPLTLLAPLTPSHGCWFGVRDVKLKAHLNNITLDGNGQLMPGGDTTYVMNRRGDAVFFVFDSTNGWVRA